MKLPPTSRAKVLDVLFQANKSDGDKTCAAARDALSWFHSVKMPSELFPERANLMTKMSSSVSRKAIR